MAWRPPGDLLEAALGAHHEASAAGFVGLREVAATVEVAARREVGALDVLERDLEIGAHFGLLFGQQRDRRVEHLGEVVRRDVGGHAHGDAGAAVDDEVRHARGQHAGLAGGLVVVGDEVDRVAVDVGEHFTGETGHARLGVTHGGGWVAVDGAEVALAVDHGVAQDEVLRQAHHGVVNGGVAMGMVRTHHVADDLGGLGVLLVVLQAHFLHAVEDAAVDGLEAVAGIRQRAADDDRHRVVEIRPPHLLLDIDREHVQGAGAGGGIGAVSATAAGRRIVGVGVLRRGLNIVV